METLEEKIARVLKEDVAVVPYDPRWRGLFEEEKALLLSCLPITLVKRIEHFGSTAVPDLAAKPIVDMLVEVTSLDETRQKVPPLFEPKGYDYFWRPPFDDASNPDEFYAWFIKRNSKGKRTHHIHMVEADSKLWERLLFRDYLIEFPHIARQYEDLKLSLSEKYTHDRIAYTKGKTEFIVRLTKKAIEYYNRTR